MNFSEARKLEALDKKHVWHPFTQMKEWCQSPMVMIESACGNYLIDTAGRKYLDGVSSLWCNVHGHRVPEIDAAVKKQLGRIAHSTFLGLSHVPAAQLTKRLIKIAPKRLTRVFYSDSGSAAVEVALKMAYQYWRQLGKKKKKNFLKLQNAYHGDTLGSVSVGGIQLFHDIFHPLLFKTFKVAAPYAYRDSFKGNEAAYAKFCASKIEKILRRHHSQIAAIVMEPLMQGAAGMLEQPKGYLALVQKLCQRYDVLLIVDEVATGFGRTGKMFACEHERVTPDFLCVAKGITGGYLPLSCTLTTEKIYSAFLGKYEDFKAFYHGHTYSANPLACAAAIANLDLFEKQKTLQKLQPKIRLLTKELQKIKNYAHVGDIRQKGFMAGIELVRNKKTKEPYSLAEKRAFRVAQWARSRGVMIRPLGNVVVLMPPLSLTSEEVVRLCRVIGEGIRRITEET